jgi:hypothetical protein
MTNVMRARRICRGRIQMEWQQFSNWRVRRVCGIRLLERGALVRESAHSAIAPKIVIERAIFLDKNDDVLDIRQFTAGAGTRRINGAQIQTATTM